MSLSASMFPTGRYRRLLMTGGTGFVGRHLCPLLVEALPAAERLILTRPDDPVARAGFALSAVDLLDGVAVEEAVATFQPDLILHLAAQSSVGVSQHAALDTWRVNTAGTLNLAAAVARHVPATTFFFVSTGEVYGATFNEGPVSETSVPRPGNAYARSKLAAEMALGDMLPTAATLIVARSFNHTGVGQDERFVLPSFAAQIAGVETGTTGPRIHVGNLDAERDFLHVTDVCAAYLALIASASPGGRETVNVASGKAYRIGDLLDGLRRRARVPFDVVPDPSRMRPSDVARAVGRPDKLASLTGWLPQVSIETLLDDVLADARRRGIEGRSP